MKLFRAVYLLVATGALAGCGKPILVVSRAPTLPVSAAGDESLPGVPFYVKTAGCKHETVWLQPVYTLTLTTTFTPASGPGTPDKAQPTVESEGATLTLEQYRNDAVVNLRSDLAAIGTAPVPTAQVETIRRLWKNVRSLEGPDPYTVAEDQLSGKDSGKVIRVANQVIPEKYVDYKTTYYYNSRKPLAGTSQATIKLADDGTLTEASAQVETKTLETFLSLVPAKDVLTKLATAYLPAGVASIAQQPLPGTYRLELITSAKIFQHTHYAMVRNPSNGEYQTPPCPEPAGDVVSPYNVTMEELTTPPKESGQGQTVKVNGSIQLPGPKEQKK